MAPVRVLALALLAVAAARAAAPPASLKFFLGESGIEEMQSVLNPLLMGALSNLSLPSQAINSGIGMKLYLTNIVLESASFATESVTLQPPDAIAVSLSGLTAAVSMSWEYTDGPGIDWSGTAQDTVSQSSLALTLVASSDGQGHALLQVASCAVDIGALDISLHGDGGSFFQAIANLMRPVIISLAQSQIAAAVTSSANAGLKALFASVPVSVPLPRGLGALDYALVASQQSYGLTGTRYSNNHFSGGGSPLALADLSHVSLGAYDSFDVSGFFVPGADDASGGPLSLQLHLTQRGQVDLALPDGSTLSAGSLEMHNPGMCWPETATHTTGAAALNASGAYPLRLRFQSGCGGGWVELHVCFANATCAPVQPLQLTTQPNAEAPVTVWPDALELSVDAGAAPPGVPLDALPFARPRLGDHDGEWMAGLALSEFFFDSLLFTLASGGALTLNVTDAQIPPASPLRLNTYSLRFLFPGLYAAYPNASLALLLAPAAPDSLALHLAAPPAPGATLSGAMCANLSVLAPGGAPPVNALDLDLGVTAAATLALNGSRLTGALSALGANLSLAWSSVPVPNLNSSVAPLVNWLLSSLAMPLINARLAQGVPLPLPAGLALQASDVYYSQGALFFGADLTFAPPPHVRASLEARETVPAEDAPPLPRFDV
jgi:hypothetical protein